MDELTLKLIIGLLSGLILFLVTVLKMFHDRYREIKLKLSDKKYETYSEIIATLFDMVNRQKGLNKVTDDEILQRLMNVKRDLLLYGNDQIIRKFFEWEVNQLTGKRLWNWAELAALVRKDMGNRWTNITADDILKSLLSATVNYENFKRELLNQRTSYGK
jgi:flagellar motor component MotA